jgi:transposase
MTVYKRIGKLLKFKDFRCNGLAFRGTNRLEVLVKPCKNGLRCPHCGRRGKIIRQRPEPRFWRDIPVGPWSVWLMYWPREIRCDTHGRVTERLPWADADSRVTYRLEYLILRYGQIMTQKAAAALLRMPASTLSDLLHRLVSRLREGRRIRGLKMIGIDEISYHKGHKYARLVYDLDRSCEVWIGQGRGVRPLTGSSTRC